MSPKYFLTNWVCIKPRENIPLLSQEKAEPLVAGHGGTSLPIQEENIKQGMIQAMKSAISRCFASSEISRT